MCVRLCPEYGIFKPCCTVSVSRPGHSFLDCRHCLNLSLKSADFLLYNNIELIINWSQMLRPKKLSPVAFYTNNCTFCLRNTCVQHFLMSRHFLPHVEISEAANNSNTTNTAPCVALWLLSRIALISQFIAIYKNMKNADGIQIRAEGEMHKGRAVGGGGEGATIDRPMQIKFIRVFSFCVSFRSNEANGCHGTAIGKFWPISFQFGFDKRRMRSLNLFNI